MQIDDAANHLVNADLRFQSIRENLPEIQSLELVEMYRALSNRAVFLGQWNDNKVVVKIVTKHNDTAHFTKILNFQNETRKTMQGGLNRMPEILFCAPQYGLFVFEYLDGIGLDDLLVKSDPKQAVEIYKNAGGWLRAFTQSSAAPSRIFKKKLLEQSSQYLTWVTDADTLELAKRLFERLNDFKTQIGQIEIDRAITHRDYYPRNLIQTQDALYGIDIENTGHFFILDDVARFLVGASYMHPTKHDLMFGLDQRFLYAFLDGYGVPTDENHMRVLRFFIAKSVLEHVCSRNEKIRKQPQFAKMARHLIAIDAHI